MIYMLRQCKDAIDNPAALSVWITRRELSVWGAWHAIRILADIRAALTNQELALAVRHYERRQKIRKNNGGQIYRGCMWVPGAVRYYFVLLQKQEYIF